MSAPAVLLVAQDQSSDFCCVVVVVLVVVAVAGRGADVVVCSVVVVFLETVSEPQLASMAAPVMRIAPSRMRLREVVMVMIFLRRG